MEKLDLRKKYKPLYQPSEKKVEVVDVPALKFVMIDGQIEPGMAPGTSPVFHEAMMAAYGISFTLKFMSKLRIENPIDYSVMALEALWWVEDGDFDITLPDNWKWTVMMLQPDHITADMFAAGLEQLRVKRGESEALAKMRLEGFTEGLCVQTMHFGPYSAEMATIAKMQAFMEENGYRRRGQHHEIYLGDPRRTSPEKLKTVLRQPVE